MQSFPLTGKISCQNSVFYSRIEVGVGGGIFGIGNIRPWVPELELYHIVTVDMMLMRTVVGTHHQKTRKTSIGLQGAAFDDHLDPLHLLLSPPPSLAMTDLMNFKFEVYLTFTPINSRRKITLNPISETKIFIFLNVLCKSSKTNKYNSTQCFGYS